MSINDGPAEPVVQRRSGTANPENLPLLLSVPNLAKSIAESDTLQPADPVANEIESDVLPPTVSSPEQRPCASTAATVNKTVHLAKMFTGNARNFGTLGTIAAAIFACTLVARGMKEDHSGAVGSISELAFRDPPTLQESELGQTEFASLVEANPDFPPTILSSNEGQQLQPTQQTTPQHPLALDRSAPLSLEPNHMRQPDLASAGKVATSDIAEISMPNAVRPPSDTLPNLHQPRLEVSTGDWAQRQQSGSNASIGEQRVYRSPFGPPVNQNATTPVSTGPLAGGTVLNSPRNAPASTIPSADVTLAAVPVNPADVWQQFEQARSSTGAARTMLDGYRSAVESTAAIPSPTSTPPAGQGLAAEEQVEPTYPSTSRTAYPSFQDYKAGLHQQRIQREQQLRFKDRRSMAPQNGLGTSRLDDSPREFR